MATSFFTFTPIHGKYGRSHTAVPFPMLRRTILTLAMAFLTFVPGLYAGWVLTGRYIDREGNTILQRWFIQDYQVKFEQYDLIYTINLKTDALILVDPVNLVYYRGTVGSYIQGIRDLKMKRLEALLEEIPEKDREAARAAYLEEIEKIGAPVIPISDTLAITEVHDTLKAVGKPTIRYQVSVNGRRLEDCWISPLLDVTGQFSWSKYFYVLSVIDPSNVKLRYMSTDAYLDLLSKGFPVRRIVLEEGYKTEYQINREEQKDIPGYEFGIPDRCKELDLEHWLNRNIAKDTEYDDYE